jgi:hypothetical protein
MARTITIDPSRAMETGKSGPELDPSQTRKGKFQDSRSTRHERCKGKNQTSGSIHHKRKPAAKTIEKQCILIDGNSGQRIKPSRAM